jgi:hypothetical protein
MGDDENSVGTDMTSEDWGGPADVEVTPVPCEWFARCDNTTTQGISHPILGMVPCCERCARVVSATDSLQSLADE